LQFKKLRKRDKEKLLPTLSDQLAFSKANWSDKSKRKVSLFLSVYKEKNEMFLTLLKKIKRG